MPARTLPNLGLQAFFDLGEDGWKDETDLGFLKLSVLVQGVVDSIEAAEPGAPANGDVVILDETHATHPNEIAIRDDGAWVYVVPVEGWMLYSTADSAFFRLEGGVWTEFAGGGYTDAQARAAISVAPSVVSTTTYTLVLADAYGYIRLTHASGCDVTVPPNATEAFAIGTVITFRNAGAGISALVAGAGVTLNPRGGSGGSLDFAEEGATVQIKKVATNEWDIIGGTAD